MNKYEELIDFLESKTLEKSQFCKNNGEITRFLDINKKLNIKDHIIRMYLMVGICRLLNVLKDVKDSNPSKYLTYLFYDLILHNDPKNFPFADLDVINDDDSAGGDNLDSAIISLLFYSDDIWIRVHPEHVFSRPDYYVDGLFPPKCGVLTGIDTDVNFYPILTGELWHILDSEYGEDSSIPSMIISTSRLKDVSFKSCWKLNEETSVDFHYATYRGVDVGLDFESCINKMGPIGFDLLSRNDLCCSGKSDYKNWILLYSEYSSKRTKHLEDLCSGYMVQREAFRLYKCFHRLFWFVKLLIQE